MSHSQSQWWKRLGAATLTAVLLVGCSRDPNVRKQKYFESGKRYFDKQQYREAAIQYQNALQVDPKYPQARYQLAQCYLKMAMWSQAYQELLRTVELQPENLKAQLDLGNLLVAARQFKEAQERAERVLQKEANNLEAHILLANAFAGLENPAGSLREMKYAIELDPKRSESYLNLAWLQLRAKQTGPAEESFKKAMQLDPHSVVAAITAGNFYQQQRRWPEAEQQFRRAIELEPQSLQPRAALAGLYLAQGQPAQVEQVLLETKRALRDNPEGYRMLGDFYFRLGEWEKALTEYASLYQEHPKDLQVKKNYVQVLILRARLDEATRLNDEILKQNPKDVAGLIYRGQILSRQGRSNDAIPALEVALKSEPDNAVAHYHLGIAFSQVGNLGRAESEWREAVRLRPNMVEAQRALAQVAQSKGDFDQLRERAEQLISTEPASPEGYILRATARLSRDRVGGEADLQKAIELAPQNPIGYSRLGSLRFAEKRFNEAEKLFEQALERDSNFSEALQGLVGVYIQQKQPAKAVARVNAQIAKAPDNSAYYLLLGMLLTSTKDLEKAEAVLEKAVELNKNNVDAFLLLGQVQLRRGSADKAIVSYQRSIQENPREVRTYVLLGALEESRGNWQKAQELYQKALKIEPEYPLGANNLAYLMLEHGGNTDVALTWAQVARRQMPDSPNAADTLAWAYYHKAAYGLAIGLLEDAVKKLPQNATFHYHLGLVYQKTNEKTRARVHLERALQIDPKYIHAAEIHKALAELSGD